MLMVQYNIICSSTFAYSVQTSTMFRKIAFSSFLVIIALNTCLAQKLKKADKAIVSSLQSSIGYLADDKLEGRRAGTHGEQLALDYISIQFERAGLQPKGEKGSWLQPFDINDGKEISKSSMLFINGTEIPSSDYFPFIGSPDKLVESAPAIALRENGVAWFLNLKEELDSNKNNPHFDVKEYVLEQVKDAVKKNATAFIVYNTGSIDDGLKFDSKEKVQPLGIPVFYVKPTVAKKYFNDESATVELKLKAVFTDKKRIGHNVVGYIDNGAATTVIAGAHFDHLGYGEDNNSMYRGPEKLIHNGADDNASGTAALIELSKLLKASKLKGNNYLFIAFSGEELGLFGSKYYSEHPTIDLSRVNYMINMDMVGRLNDSSRALTIGGYGTSPEWSNLFASMPTDKNFTNKYDSSGTGPSDHTSFYRKNIPVLFFFTGLHKDYHRPTDDADKINYTGELAIIKYIYRIIETENNKNKLVFTKTRETQSTSSARFSVTMGIMPDYTFSGNGVRADGISEGRPAEKAGLKTGDIIIQLGDYTVSSVENYMQVLGKFKKGDKTKVKVKRGNETIEAAVQF